MSRGTQATSTSCRQSQWLNPHHILRQGARCGAAPLSGASGEATPPTPSSSSSSNSDIATPSQESQSASDPSPPTPSSPAPLPFSSSSRRSVADELKLPRSGYFSIADTNAEVYSKAGQVFDPRAKGDRYKSSFIWNTNWSEALSRQESLQRKADAAAADRKSSAASSKPSSAGFQGPAAAASQLEQANGFVSFTRMADLDRMDIDMSAALKPRKPKAAPVADPAVAAAALATANRRRAQSTFTDAGGQTFTRKEVGRLSRTSASQARGTPAKAVIVRSPELVAALAVSAEAELVKYEAMKVESQMLTLAFIVAGGALTYLAYSKDICISYLIGAIGGYLYLRLLGRSVDAIGGSGVAAGLGSLASQQRLLIPVVLVLLYNRYNTLYADDLGVRLQLLPELVGFFTYKFAVVFRQGQEVLNDMTPQPKRIEAGEQQQQQQDQQQ
ncbi:MAG: hypothetical protein WDW38_007187 [Sanguina aurantia]